MSKDLKKPISPSNIKGLKRTEARPKRNQEMAPEIGKGQKKHSIMFKVMAMLVPKNGHLWHVLLRLYEP